MKNQVVARFKDGRVLKGTAGRVDPDRPSLRVELEDGAECTIPFRELKALFFVRSLEGDPRHDERLVPDPSDPRGSGSTVVRVEFEDDEVVVGLTHSYPPNGDLFYLVPVDPKSNNVRILVNREAVRLMEAIPL